MSQPVAQPVYSINKADNVLVSQHLLLRVVELKVQVNYICLSVCQTSPCTDINVYILDLN